MPTPIATYFVPSSGQSTATISTPSFTPSNGEDVVVKLATWDTAIAMGAPTGGSQTYTARVTNAPGGFNEWCAIYTMTVSGSPGSMTISSTPGASARYSMCVERWAAGSLAASPVTNSGTGVGAVAAGTITPTAGTSAISWVSGDAQSIDPATRAYLNSGTDEGVRDDHVGANGVDYYGYQAASGTGSQSYGLSAPGGQTFVIAAIEILDTGGAPAFTDPIWTPHSLIPPGRISPAGFWVPWTGDATGAAETQVPIGDTGSSSEALDVTAAVPLADAGSAADALTATAAVPLADTGSAADTLTVAVTTALSDGGSEAEALAVSAAVPLTDGGSAADAIDNGLGTSKTLSDTGSAADSLTVSAAVPLADGGAAADSLLIAATAGLADGGSSAETLTVAATVPLADAGSAADALDNGTGTAKPIGDTGTAVDTLTVTVALALTDTGAGADTVATGASVPLADSGSASQAFGVAATAQLADAGSATQSLTIAVAVPLADAGSAADTAIGQDNAFVTKTLTDAGGAIDALSFVPSLITGRTAVTGDPATATVTGDPVVAQVTGVD